MRTISWVPGLLALATLLASLAAPRGAHAFHSVFDYKLDRFEIDGNAFGPLDGTADLVDEHDNGILGPTWQTYIGTASESGGYLHFTNPGVHFPVEGGVVDVSNVESTVDVTTGLGDFTATTYWAAELPAPGDGINFTLLNETTLEAFTASIMNYTGLVFQQSITQFVNGTFVSQSDTLPLDPGDLTGRIVLRLAYDDATHAMQASFSLDDGATVTTPFAPRALLTTLTEGVFVPGAVPLVEAEPTTSTTSTTTSSTTSLTMPSPVECPTGPTMSTADLLYVDRSPASGDEILRARGTVNLDAAGWTGLDDGAQLFVAKSPYTGAGDDVLDLTGPAGIPAGGPGSGCDPRDGWRSSARSDVYKNFGNAFPPACAPGSAGGLKGLKVTRLSGGGLRVIVRTMRSAFSLPPLTTYVAETLVLGQGSAPATAGQCATTRLRCFAKTSARTHCAGPQ